MNLVCLPTRRYENADFPQNLLLASGWPSRRFHVFSKVNGAQHSPLSFSQGGPSGKFLVSTQMYDKKLDNLYLTLKPKSLWQMAYVILPGQESLAHMEAVWRRLVFHFFGALVILLTGFLSGLRANAVSFAFFVSRSLTSLEIFADPPQTPPARYWSVLCTAFCCILTFLLKCLLGLWPDILSEHLFGNCANVVCHSDKIISGQSHSSAKF